MNFGYMSKSYLRTYNPRTSYSDGKDIYSKGTKTSTSTSSSTKSSGGSRIKSLYNNSNNNSTRIRDNSVLSAVGFKYDMGTAANTTVEVDKGTFNEIMDYSMNNKDYKWDETGCDGTKKWVVVDGQRFDYTLSKDEKEAFELRWKTCCSFYGGTERSKSKSKALVNITLDKDDKAVVSKDEKESNNPKLLNLMKKPKVAKMLSDIIKSNYKKSISLDLE